MKPIRRSISRFFSCALLLLFTILMNGCVQQVKLTVLKPAEINTAGIKKVALGSFEIIEVNRELEIERNGVWDSKRVQFTPDQKKALQNQIRARVINLLSATPYFKLVYTDEFQTLENDAALQNAIAAGGFKTTEADAVINGKIWLDVSNLDGVDPAEVELEYLQGGRENSFNYKVQVVAFWPYKSIRGTLGLEMKLTRLNPTEVVAVVFDARACSYKLGGEPAGLQEQIASGVSSITSALTKDRQAEEEIEESPLVLPNFEQLVADMSESIAAKFTRKIAVTESVHEYTVASGGNKTVQMLIQAGAYEKALERLGTIYAQTNKYHPDDLYNQGLCYEALGDYGLAAVAYEDALKIDPGNLTYAQGVGRIDKLKRENLKLKEQLASKKQP